MESGSSFMKNLWNPVRLLENGPVFLKIFFKIVRLFEKIRYKYQHRHQSRATSSFTSLCNMVEAEISTERLSF